MIKYIARAMKRQVANRIAYIVLAVIIALVPALIGGYSANASIPANENISVVDELFLQGMGPGDGYPCSSGEKIDLTNDWLTFSTEQSNFTFPTTNTAQHIQSHTQYVSDIMANINSPEGSGWAVQQIFPDDFSSVNGFHQVRIYTFDPDSNLVMNNDGRIHANNLKFLEFYINSNWGDCRIQFQQYTGYNVYRPATNDLMATDNFFILAGDVTYPDGYTGPTIPDTVDGSGKTVIRPTISATITDKTVVFKLDKLPFKPCRVNYMISYSTKNNNDYGESVLETLKLGWKQIFSGDVTLEQWRNGSDLYDSEVIDFKYKINPEEEVIATAPDEGSIMVFIGVETDWQGAPYKLCGDNGSPDDFEYEVDYRLQFINIDGSNYVIDGTQCDPNSNICDTTTAKSDLMDCFSDSFPFINITECKNAVAVLGERLSFSRVQFGNSWIYSPQCQQLGTLGDWIGANNKTVCPYFPNYVRSTIDPFVTFILGLLVVTFIARQTGKDF